MSRAAVLLLTWLAAALVASAAELTDPTRPALLPPPPTGPAPTDAGLALDSIFISETRRVAVIDGRRVEVGDPVGGARVVGIAISGVRLRGSAGEWLLTLTGTEVKTGRSER